MEDTTRITAAIRDYIARQHISREEFAHRTRLGKSTIDKLLIGLFSERTLAIVEETTGLTLRAAADSGANESSKAASGAGPIQRPASGPSIAVLPFANLGRDPAQDYIADGLAEDITTDLSRLRFLFVIARNSTLAYRDRPTDVRQVARDLGVRYVLEGTTRIAAGRIRVTSQLVDAEVGRQVWAERYDRDLTDIFAVQDEITRNVVAAIEPHLYDAEGFRAARHHPDSIDAWGLVVRAIGLISKVGRRQNEQARIMLERAIALEPAYARAYAVLAWAEWWSALCYWWEDPQLGYQAAFRHAEQAVALDAHEPWARMTLGLSLSTARQHARALVELRAALEFNPNFALGQTAYGWALLRAGRIEDAIEETGKALRMSPIDSFAGFYTAIHGLALLGARQFDDALPYLRASVAAFAEYLGHYNTLISCCGHLGLLDEAKGFIVARNRMGPEIRIGLLRRNLSGFAHCEVFIEGLQKAGVPE